MTRAAPGWARVARRPRFVVLADGLVIEGFGLGATGEAVGEVCFNTAMTGYEEILTDPSYAGQIVTFTFPHIGVVGTNDEDIETVNLRPRRRRARRDPARRRRRPLQLSRHAPARRLAEGARNHRRQRGRHPRADRAHPPARHAQRRDRPSPRRRLRSRRAARQGAALPGIDGMDLVPDVGATQRYDWDETSWTLDDGYGQRAGGEIPRRRRSTTASSATSCGCSPIRAAR